MVRRLLCTLELCLLPFRLLLKMPAVVAYHPVESVGAIPVRAHASALLAKSFAHFSEDHFSRHCLNLCPSTTGPIVIPSLLLCSAFVPECLLVGIITNLLRKSVNIRGGVHRFLIVVLLRIPRTSLRSRPALHRILRWERCCFLGLLLRAFRYDLCRKVIASGILVGRCHIINDVLGSCPHAVVHQYILKLMPLVLGPCVIFLCNSLLPRCLHRSIVIV